MEAGAEREEVGWVVALRRAQRRSRRHAIARYAQLATVEAGAPRCRTVVVRGVDAERGAVWFVTDGRSAKAAQLVADPRAEICWYFAGLREQYRLRGAIEPLEPAARQEAWEGLSPASRAVFFAPPPGTPRGEGDRFAETSEAPEPPACFRALRLVVARAELLELRPSPHERRAWVREGEGWVSARLRP